MTYIERIESKLSEKKITKKAMLADLELNANTFWAWRERGTVPSADTLYKVAKYLDTTVEYLLTGTEPTVSLSTEQRELLDMWDGLDDQGRTLVKAKAIEELRRLGK